MKRKPVTVAWDCFCFTGWVSLESLTVNSPIKTEIMNNGIANGISRLCHELVLVLITHSRTFNSDVPIAPLLRIHRIGGSIPVIERSDHGDLLGMGSPDAEQLPIKLWPLQLSRLSWLTSLTQGFDQFVRRGRPRYTSTGDIET
jgi:hypothetical protein